MRLLDFSPSADIDVWILIWISCCSSWNIEHNTFGGLSKGSQPVFKRVLEKTTEYSEQLSRQTWLGIEPGTSRLPVLRQNHSATSEALSFRETTVLIDLSSVFQEHESVCKCLIRLIFASYTVRILRNVTHGYQYHSWILYILNKLLEISGFFPENINDFRNLVDLNKHITLAFYLYFLTYSCWIILKYCVCILKV